MASKEHWDVTDERDMWLKVIGKEQEDRTETTLQFSKILDGIPTDGACLEIGCGAGRFARFAVWHFDLYVGIDSSESILSYARLNDHIGVKEFVYTDGTHIPFTDGLFDFVFSFTCFQHMPTLEMVQANLREAYRVLAPGGLCRIQTVKGTPDPDYFDGWVFPSPEAFAKEFTDVGFTVIDAHTEDLWIWVTARK